MSRYGIKVTEDQVRNIIFSDLAGGSADENCIDITEVVAILIIPFLRKLVMNSAHGESILQTLSNPNQNQTFSNYEREALANKYTLQEFDRTIIEKVLSIILTDVTGSIEPQLLTKDMLMQIFLAYDEHDLAHDEALLSDMIAMAVGGAEGRAFLDVDSFSRGLASDLKLYDPTKETRFSTHYEDVFGYSGKVGGEPPSRNQPRVLLPHGDDSEFFDASNGQQESTFTEVFTLSQIDFQADSFRDKTHYLLAWLATSSAFYSYVLLNTGILNFYGIDVCAIENRQMFRCDLLKSCASWLTLMAVMFGIVAPYVMILSLGNDIFRNSIVDIGIGILGIGVLIFFPALYKKVDVKVFSTAPINSGDESYVTESVNITIGCALLLIQVFNLIRMAIPDRVFSRNKFLTLLFRGSGVKAEFGIKQSAQYKVHSLVKNAYELHVENDSSFPEPFERTKMSTSASVLLNYNKVQAKHQRRGGFVWSWGQVLSGKLNSEQGIWLHTRSLAAFAAQIVVTIVLVAVLSMRLGSIIDIVYPSKPVPQNDRCGSYFQPSKCVFPQVLNISNGIAVCKDVSFENPDCFGDVFQSLSGNALEEVYCDFFEAAQTNTDNTDTFVCP